jgi:large subunit ribosomal protein L15
MINLSSLFPKHGSRKSKRRIGLGVGSGMGRSATKGMKGQTSRSGNTRKESKEGGQMPLVRRIPKSGFSNASFAKKVEIVGLGALEKIFKAGEEITPEILKKKNLIKKIERVKVLANGEINKALKISAHAFSAAAKKAVEKAGGAITVLEKKAAKLEKQTAKAAAKAVKKADKSVKNKEV